MISNPCFGQMLSKLILLGSFLISSVSWGVTFSPLVTIVNGEVQIDPVFLAMLEEIQAASALPYNIHKKRKHHFSTSTPQEFATDHCPRFLCPGPDTDPAELLPFPRVYPGRVYSLLMGRSGAWSVGATKGWPDLPGVVIYNPADHSIIISLRGTVHIRDWLTNLFAVGISGSSVGLDAVHGSVHRGMGVRALSYLEQLQQILMGTLEGLDMETRGSVRIYVVGHSLGGGLAMLTGAQLAAFFQLHPTLLGYEESVEFHNPTHNRIGIYGISVPRVVIGDAAAEQMSALVGPNNIIRRNHANDFVTVAYPRLFFRSLGFLALDSHRACADSPTRSTLAIHAVRDGIGGIGRGLRHLGVMIEDGAEAVGDFCVVFMEEGREAAMGRVRRFSFADLRQAAPALLHLVNTPFAMVFNFGSGLVRPLATFVRDAHFARGGYSHANLEGDLHTLLADGAAHQLRRGRAPVTVMSVGPFNFDDAVFYSTTSDGSQTFQHATVAGDGACGYSAFTQAAQAAGLTLTTGTRQGLIETLMAFQQNGFTDAPVGLEHAVGLAIATHGSFEAWIAALDGGLWMGQNEMNIMAIINGIGIHVYVYDQHGHLVSHPHMIGGLNSTAPHHINLVFVQHTDEGQTVYHGNPDDPTHLASLMHFDPLIPIASPGAAVTPSPTYSQMMQATLSRFIAALFAVRLMNFRSSRAITGGSSS